MVCSGIVIEAPKVLPYTARPNPNCFRSLKRRKLKPILDLYKPQPQPIQSPETCILICLLTLALESHGAFESERITSAEELWDMGLFSLDGCSRRALA